MKTTVAIVGSGRMASVFANQLPKETRKIIINRNIASAKILADKVNGIAYDSYECVKEADVIALIIPASVVNEVLEEVIKYTKEGSIVINMATSARINPDLIRENKDIVDTKIIGHAKSMSEWGEPGLVVVNTDDLEIFNIIKSQLPGYKNVVIGDSDLVEKINSIALEEGIKAAVEVRKKLENLLIPEEWVTTAIRTCTTGGIKSYLEDDLGHFGKKVVEKLENI